MGEREGEDVKEIMEKREQERERDAEAEFNFFFSTSLLMVPLEREQRAADALTPALASFSCVKAVLIHFYKRDQTRAGKREAETQSVTHTRTQSHGDRKVGAEIENTLSVIP